MSRRNVGHFDRWARSYEQFRGQHYFDQLHQAMLDSIPDAGDPPARILDIGCGTGRLLRKARLRWPAAALVGVDPAPGMIDEARRLAPAISFHVAGAESLPLPDASVDLVLSASSLHHWDDQAAGLRNVVRVLAPGGRFCFGDVTMAAWLAKVLGSTARTAEGLREAFLSAGLRIDRQGPMHARWLYVTTGGRGA
jgi:ubiquinone/menaquinone biosynthesis C-methylase UbiE